MAIQVILAPLFHEVDDRHSLEAALTIAKRFGGHVDALLAQPDPLNTIPMVGEGVSADTIRRLMESAAAAMEEQRAAVKATFDEICAAADIALIDRPDHETEQPSIAWREVTGQNEDVTPERALLSDLVVFSHAKSKAVPALQPTFEAVLLKARRPILLVPDKAPAPIGHNVAIAWNGTPESKHALSAAMPFLSEAVAVHLLTAVTSNTDAETIDGASDYLAWHGIGSERHVVEADGEPIGAALMQKAKAAGADLLVMGGYGHNRLRERILGGVTHHIVNQPELPILLAH